MLMGSSNLMTGLTLVLVICLAIVLALVLVLLAELYCFTILSRRRGSSAARTTAGVPLTTGANHNPLTNLGVLSVPRSILYPTTAGAGDIESPEIFKKSAENQEFDRNVISGRKDEVGLVYISNPVFDGGENGCRSKVGNTPFETPESSPSRLETEEESSDEEETMSVKMAVTPPITPMKKLAAVVDGDGVGGGGSENSSNGVSSSSPCGTPCTSSLSW